MNSCSGILAIGILLITVSVAYGQDYGNLEGKIMDAKSRLALPYANIVINNSAIGLYLMSQAPLDLQCQLFSETIHLSFLMLGSNPI
jgi:hypothetical protein